MLWLLIAKAVVGKVFLMSVELIVGVGDLENEEIDADRRETYFILVRRWSPKSRATSLQEKTVPF